MSFFTQHSHRNPGRHWRVAFAAAALAIALTATDAVAGGHHHAHHAIRVVHRVPHVHVPVVPRRVAAVHVPAHRVAVIGRHRSFVHGGTFYRRVVVHGRARLVVVPPPRGVAVVW